MVVKYDRGEQDRNLIYIKRFRSPAPARMTRARKKLDTSAFLTQSSTAKILIESETLHYVPDSSFRL